MIESPFSFSGAVVWMGALATLALYSILYRENPVYRFAEHIFLGLATGYGLYAVWRDVLYPLWYKPFLIDGEWGWILAAVAGAMYYTIYSKKLNWMSRLVLMVMMGLAAGLAFRKFYGAYIPQIGASFKPLFVFREETGALDTAASLTNALYLTALLTVMSYFFFSFRQKGQVVTKSAVLGRWMMMIAFGAMFGSTVMARMSLFIGRLTYLFSDWIHLIPK